MSQAKAPEPAVFGYMSTWDSPEHGCLGGYLLVSELGRPLEFHCTAPIRTSRAQQILYGPTLWPYVLGDQIAGTLLAEAKLRPQVVIADHAAVLCLRPRIAIPMVQLISAVEPRTAEVKLSDAIAGCAPLQNLEQSQLPQDDVQNCMRTVVVGGHVFELPTGFEQDHDQASHALLLLAENVDLAEPFDRIREAIREAQRLGEQYQGAHEEAA